MLIFLSSSDSDHIASTAASMVSVTYTNVQPPLLDIHKAIEQGSVFPDKPDPVVVGDADREFFVLCPFLFVSPSPT